MTFVNPLDLQELIVGTFSGSWMIFFFVMFIAIAILAARFRMSNINLIILFGLFAIFMAAWADWLLIVAVIIIAMIGIIYVIKPFKN